MKYVPPRDEFEYRLLPRERGRNYFSMDADDVARDMLSGQNIRTQLTYDRSSIEEYLSD